MAACAGPQHTAAFECDLIDCTAAAGGHRPDHQPRFFPFIAQLKRDLRAVGHWVSVQVTNRPGPQPQDLSRLDRRPLVQGRQCVAACQRGPITLLDRQPEREGRVRQQPFAERRKACSGHIDRGRAHRQIPPEERVHSALQKGGRLAVHPQIGGQPAHFGGVEVIGGLCGQHNGLLVGQQRSMVAQQPFDCQAGVVAGDVEHHKDDPVGVSEGCQCSAGNICAGCTGTAFQVARWRGRALRRQTGRGRGRQKKRHRRRVRRGGRRGRFEAVEQCSQLHKGSADNFGWVDDTGRLGAVQPFDQQSQRVRADGGLLFAGQTFALQPKIGEDQDLVGLVERRGHRHGLGRWVRVEQGDGGPSQLAHLLFGFDPFLAGQNPHIALGHQNTGEGDDGGGQFALKRGCRQRGGVDRRAVEPQFEPDDAAGSGVHSVGEVPIFGVEGEKGIQRRPQGLHIGRADTVAAGVCQQEEIVARHESVLGHAAVLFSASLLKIPAQRRSGQRARHDKPPLALPVCQPFLAQDGAQLGGQAERTAPAVSPLQARIAHVAGHQQIGGTGVAGRVEQRRDLARDSEKGGQRVLAQLSLAGLNCGNLGVGHAVGVPLPGKTSGNGGNPPVAAVVDPFDKGTAQLGNPVGVAAKGVEPQRVDLFDVARSENIQIGAEQQIETDRTQFTAHNLAGLLDQISVPRGTHRQRGRQRGKATAQRRCRQVVPALKHPDQKGQISRRFGCPIGQVKHPIARRPGRYRHRVHGMFFWQQHAVGQRLQLIGEHCHLTRGVDPPRVRKIAGQRAQQNSADGPGIDQVDKIAVDRDLAAGQHDHKKLPNPLLWGHPVDNLLRQLDQLVLLLDSSSLCARHRRLRQTRPSRQQHHHQKPGAKQPEAPPPRCFPQQRGQTPSPGRWLAGQMGCVHKQVHDMQSYFLDNQPPNRYTVLPECANQIWTVRHKFPCKKQNKKSPPRPASGRKQPVPGGGRW